MGLYDDLQTDLTEAWNNDLSDAVVDIEFTILSAPVYDPSTGVSTPTEVVHTMRGIVLINETKEITQEPNRTHDLEIIILDVDKTEDFVIDTKVTYNGGDYKISEYEVDPVTASHTIKCVRWG